MKYAGTILKESTCLLKYLKNAPYRKIKIFHSHVFYSFLNIFVFQQQQNPGRRFGAKRMHLSLPVACAALRSKAVVLLLLVRC